jgi:prepilin-type N-terminal cleavage/methylation domain-containing protein
MRKRGGWYPISLVGKLLTVCYIGLLFPLLYLEHEQLLDRGSQYTAIGVLIFVTLCMFMSRIRNEKPFKKHGHKHPEENAFTLIELLMVISIIGLLAVIVTTSLASARQKSYMSRAKLEFKEIAEALELYANDHNGNYPPDVSRSVPPGLEPYLKGGTWPPPPWPNSYYDWDNWAPTDMVYAPNTQTYQISIRFCSAVGTCTIPNETWAAGFDYYSALYYCVGGSCRPHASQPTNYPGLCVNC